MSDSLRSLRGNEPCPPSRVSPPDSCLFVCPSLHLIASISFCSSATYLLYYILFCPSGDPWFSVHSWFLPYFVRYLFLLVLYPNVSYFLSLFSSKYCFSQMSCCGAETVNFDSGFIHKKINTIIWIFFSKNSKWLHKNCRYCIISTTFEICSL